MLLKFNIPRLYYLTHYYSWIECQPFLSIAEVIQEAHFAQYGKKNLKPLKNCLKSSYIISKCRSIKTINIPWSLVPHVYLLSVQICKRLRLGAFKESLFRKINGRKVRFIKINTFADALMFILHELKDILSGE